MLYNRGVKKWDAVIVGGGVIGLSLALRLKDQHLSVLLLTSENPQAKPLMLPEA